MATNKGDDLTNYVEQFRQIYEPQKHWEARKMFLMNNWGDYPERQLVSLSRVWANMEFDGCQYEPELMERVRELAAGVEVSDVPLDRGPKATNTRGLGYSNQHQQGLGFSTQHQQQQQQLKRQHQQVFGGDGLLGAAPPGTAPTMSPMSTMQGTMLGSNQASSSSSGSVQPTKRYKPGDRNYDPVNPDMSFINELCHRLDWLMKRPQALLDQHWNFLNAAAHKSGFKNMEREFIEVRGLAEDEEGKPYNTRQGWILNVYIGDIKLITFDRSDSAGMWQKDVLKACGEKLLKMLLNPKSLTIKREKKVSDKGRAFDKELIQLQLPSLIDDRDVKEIYGKRNAKEQASYDPDDPFANFVLLATNDNVPPEYRAMQTLMNSSQANKGSELNITVSDTKVPVNGEDVWLCKIILNGQLIGFGTNEDQKKVKHVAATVAIDYLKKKCPQVKHNRDYQADQETAIPMSNIVRDGDIATAGLSSASKAIDSGNIGHKMLKMMGWKGEGGLGKGGFGISQPIIPIEHIRGEGLGFSEGGLNMDAVTRIVEDYIQSGNPEPLVFPATLNREERKQIHCIAHKFNLKSKSYGKDVDRYLLVSTKRSLQQLVMDHVEQGDAKGGYNVALPGAGVPRQ